MTQRLRSIVHIYYNPIFMYTSGKLLSVVGMAGQPISILPHRVQQVTRYGVKVGAVIGGHYDFSK